MALRKKKSRKRQVAELASDYLKVKTVTKTAKGAGKAAKGTAVYKVAKKTPLVKRIPVVLGAGIATLAAVKFARSRGGGEPSTA
jgi:hypothetical protein